LENRLISITAQRNAIAIQIENILEQATFGGSHHGSVMAASNAQAQSLTGQAQELLAQAQSL